MGNKYGFLLLTPVGTSKGFNDVDYRFNMGIEFEVKVTLNMRVVLSRGSRSYSEWLEDRCKIARIEG